MLILNVNFFFSGIISYIYIIVFIGGLMVLLVRVTSVVFQEQAIMPRTFLLVCLITFIFLLFYSPTSDIGKRDRSYESIFSIVRLLELYKKHLIFSILLILVICLFVLTKLMLEYKGLTRNL